MKQKLIIGALISVLIFLSCKKEKDDPFAGVPRTGTRMQLTLDSIFLYASQVYLWRDALPGYSVFAPRKRYELVTPELSAFQKELFDISQLKINPATALPYEYARIAGKPKYSTIEKSVTSIVPLAGIATAGNYLGAAGLFQTSSGNVAYIALNSFPALETCQRPLDSVFTFFAASAPGNIIVDLRNNGGGYVATAQYVADLIAPSALSGKKMYSEVYNSLMQQDKAFLLEQQPYLDGSGNTVQYNGRTATMADVDFTEKGNTYSFSKKGHLNTVKNVYFIVSGKTASAAEMLVSVLKPYINVIITGQKTYGKPVGFFALNIDVYSIYLSSFLIKNADNWCDYFDGMQPDIEVEMPHEPVLGAPDEPCLKRVLGRINGASKIKTTITQPTMQAKPGIAGDEISGAHENRLKLRQ